MNSAIPIRQPCPPGTCICGLEQLRTAADADLRIVRLTRMEERKLLDRLEAINSLADLEHMCRRMEEQLGIRLQIGPGFNEVRTMRGISIQVLELPGLCRKTRQAIPAAIRRGLEHTPQIAFDILNANDLLRGT
ncbi:hypothetical protein [Pseudomonas sp. TE3786]